MQFVHHSEWQQQQRAQGQQPAPEAERLLPSGRLAVDGEPSAFDEQCLAENLLLVLPTIRAQVTVAKGLHAVTVYPVEPMQTVVATKVFAWEQHDVAHLQFLFLDGDNHHMVAKGTDERQHTTTRHLKPDGYLPRSVRRLLLQRYPLLYGQRYFLFHHVSLAEVRPLRLPPAAIRWFPAHRRGPSLASRHTPPQGR